MGTLNEILSLMYRMDDRYRKSVCLNEEYDTDKDRAENFALRLRVLKLYKCLMKEHDKDYIIKNLKTFRETYPENQTDMYFRNLTKINGKDYLSIIADKKRNYVCIDDGTLLSDIWVDGYYGFLDDVFIVKKNSKYNYMRSDGTLIWDKTDTNEWFDDLCGSDDCQNAFYVNIRNPYKTNYLKINGDFVWNKPFDQWFDVMCLEDKGKQIFSAYNKDDNNIYILDINGNIISKEKKIKQPIFLLVVFFIFLTFFS